MKKLVLIPILSLFLAFPKEKSQAVTTAVATISVKKEDCGSYNGKKLYKGPKGGCYYINKNGNKTYVDRSYCKC